MGWRSVIITQHAKLTYSMNMMIVQTKDGSILHVGGGDRGKKPLINGTVEFSLRQGSHQKKDVSIHRKHHF